MRKTSKIRLVVGVVTLQIVRFLYFSTVFFKDAIEQPNSEAHCVVSWTTNLPVMLEFILVIIVHEFLLRLYLQLISKLD